MHEFSPEADEAITSDTRQFTHRLWVDWNNNGEFDHPLSDMSQYVTNTVRDQALTSTAPDELMLVEGHAAASLSIEVAGAYNGYPLVGHFSPYNARSVFYAQGLQLGVDMYYDIGVWTENGWEWYRQFTGVVREVSADRESGVVGIECLDNVEKLRTPVNLAAYGMLETYLQQGYKRGQLVDSSSLIDLAARSGGFDAGPVGMQWPDYVGPSYGAGEILSVPFHGSILPEVGTLDNSQGIHKTETWYNGTEAQIARAEAYRGGPFGYLARQAVPRGEESVGYHKYWVDELGRGLAGNAASTWVIGGWFYWAGPSVDALANPAVRLQIQGHHFELVLEPANGAGRARFQYFLTYNNDRWDDPANKPVGTWQTVNGPYTSLPSEPGWHYYEAAFQWNQSTGELFMKSTIDDRRGTPQSYGIFTPKGPGYDRFSGLAWIFNTWSASDVKIYNSRNRPALADLVYDVTPKRNAIFPTTNKWGRNRITHTIRESGLEAWTLAKDVASAEYGAVFFDEHGRFNFWNYQDVLDRQDTPVKTLDIGDVSSLSFNYTTDSIRNVWVVTTQSGKASWDIAYDLARDGVPLKKVGDEYLPAIFVVPARATVAQEEFFLLPAPEVVSVDPWTIQTIQTRANSSSPWTPGYWDQYTPQHGRQMYTGTRFIPREDDAADPLTEQKFTERDLIRLYIKNDWYDPVGFVNPNGSARFRVRGLVVSEEQEKTWIVRDEESIARYGERVIELRNNPWLHDEWQTREMLSKLIEHTSKPIPVTDDVTVPGDPRLQLGDTVEVTDIDGFGESVKLQILGIRRELSPENGLMDTYQV